jgi:uncharacterized 2Fe-2S/4Fe-4S cluster protein (DUF4445 family)
MTARASPPATAYRVAIMNLGREIDCGEDETLFHAARRHGVRLVGACGGRGACGSCVVRLVRGQAWFDDEALVGPGKYWRRACRMKPRQDCEVEIAPRSLAPVARAEVDAKDWLGEIAPAPAVRAFDVRVAEPSLADPRGDFERLVEALPEVGAIDLGAARALPDILRANRFSARAFVRGATVVSVAPPGRAGLGLAIDLGTTNVAGFLIDLVTGERLASLGIENPQVAWGADVVTRLNHALAGPEAQRELGAAAALAIGSLARDLAEAVGRRQDDILDVAVCGNTAMLHLLLGLSVGQLVHAPYVAAVSGALDVEARDLGLALSPSARVHAAPGVGGFVGSDHVAALLATRARWDGHGATLVMDIGTNTEISLVSGGRIVSASCPSGPALEGGNIACGMRAAEGAVERVGIENGVLVATTIGGGEAAGVCGSGVVDAIAAALRLGLLDKSGRIRDRGEGFVRVDGKPAIALAADVHILQADVRAVQLAKAAIRTGVDELLDLSGVAEQDVDRFVLAGAFGQSVDLANAVEIGLLPPLPLDRFAQVGNAAGVGVARMLASTAERARAAAIAARCRYVELNTRPQFQNRFMKNIGFAEDAGARGDAS